MSKLQNNGRKDGRQACRKDRVCVLSKHIDNCKKTSSPLPQENNEEGSKRKERTTTKVKEFYCKNIYFGQPQVFQEIFLNNGKGKGATSH